MIFQGFKVCLPAQIKAAYKNFVQRLLRIEKRDYVSGFPG